MGLLIWVGKAAYVGGGAVYVGVEVLMWVMEVLTKGVTACVGDGAISGVCIKLGCLWRWGCLLRVDPACHSVGQCMLLLFVSSYVFCIIPMILVGGDVGRASPAKRSAWMIAWETFRFTHFFHSTSLFPTAIGGELVSFGGVVKQLLEDVQQRLVFRTQVCYVLFYISSVFARNCKPSGAKV